MFENFSRMLESMNDPQMWHAISVHFPVVMAILGIPLLLISALRPRSHLARWLAIGAYLLLFLSVLNAVSSGEDAEGALSPVLSTATFDRVHDHEEMALQLRFVSFAVLLLVVLTLIPKKPLRTTMSVLSLLAALVCAGWVSVTGHLGGELVYEHGAGITRIATADDAGDDDDTPGDGTEESEKPGIDESLIDPRVVHFRNEVAPILAEHCLGCHNPSQRRGPKGGLDLTTIAGVLKGGNAGPAVQPGVPGDSELIVAVLYEDEFLQMPPDGKLSDDKINAIMKWVEDGVAWDEAIDWAEGGE